MRLENNKKTDDIVLRSLENDKELEKLYFYDVMAHAFITSFRQCENLDKVWEAVIVPLLKYQAELKAKNTGERK